MKISGPKRPAPQVPPAPPTATGKAKAADGPRFSEVLRRDVSTVDAVPSVKDQAVADVTGRLERGEISTAQATEALIEAVVRHRLDDLAPRLREALRAALRSTLENDPRLAEQIRRLGGDER